MLIFGKASSQQACVFVNRFVFLSPPAIEKLRGAETISVLNILIRLSLIDQTKLINVRLSQI